MSRWATRLVLAIMFFNVVAAIWFAAGSMTSGVLAQRRMYDVLVPMNRAGRLSDAQFEEIAPAAKAVSGAWSRADKRAAIFCSANAALAVVCVMLMRRSSLSGAADANPNNATSPAASS